MLAELADRKGNSEGNSDFQQLYTSVHTVHSSSYINIYNAGLVITGLQYLFCGMFMSCPFVIHLQYILKLLFFGSSQILAWPDWPAVFPRAPRRGTMRQEGQLGTCLLKHSTCLISPAAPLTFTGRIDINIGLHI